MKNQKDNSVSTTFSNYDFNTAPLSNPIYSLLKVSYFEEQVKAQHVGCLMPIPFPTGVGKTYNILGLIIETLLDDISDELTNPDYFPRNCFYITNSVDNVRQAYIDLLGRIEGDSRFTSAQKDVLKKRVLYAPSNDTSLVELLENKIETVRAILTLFNIQNNSAIANEIKSVIQIIELKNRVNKDPDLTKEFASQLQTKASECYSKLVSHIQKVQLGKFPIPYTDENVALLAELMPGVYLEAGIARAVFMTTKKFLFGFQQSKGKFHPVREVKDNILIIDEFDRQHHEILTHLVQANDTDLLGTLRTIHANLRLQQLCTKPEYLGIESLFDNYLDEIKYFVEHWKMQFSFDLHERAFTEGEEILLFSDKLTTHNTSLNKRLSFGFNEELKQHIISTYDTIDLNNHDFPKFLGKMERLVNRRFHSVIRAAEAKYRDNLCALYPNTFGTNISPSQAIASILDQLNLHALRVQLAKQLAYLVGHQYSERKNAANFHTRGIRMIEVDRLPEARDSVMFKHHGFDVTPTGMLATWVENGCYVLGVSATAENPSVIQNFDIRYLKSSLQNRYVELTPAQRKLIHDYYESERNYQDAGVEILAVSVEPNIAYLKKHLCTWRPEVKNIDLLLADFFELESTDNDRNINFHAGRLSKLCLAIENFAEQSSNRYMIAMLNGAIKPKLSEFMQWFVDQFSSSNFPIKFVPTINANYLKSGQFETEVIGHLEESAGKLIALTTYQTMASGKNPDYRYNLELENDSLRQVGHRSSHKTDIDCLYLENPTHLISVSGNQENRTSDRLLLLSYALSLQEVGSLSMAQCRVWCKDVVQQLSPANTCRELKYKFYGGSIDKLYSVFRVIEQAVGRTARTEMKRNKIILLADDELMDILAEDSRDDTLFSHEYKSLVRMATALKDRPAGRISREENQLRNLATLRTARSISAIMGMLNNIDERPSADTVESWEELRKLVLATPVSATPPLNSEYYLHSPTPTSYQYLPPSEENDGHKYTFFSSDGTHVVSEHDCRLNILRKNPIVSAHFESKGYALYWHPGAHYILTPPMFMNIYKGALGEEAGSAILKQYGFSIDPLPLAHFERFDGLIRLSDEQAVIDFKHWDLARWRMQPDRLRIDVMNKFVRKVQAIGLSKLVICNLLGDSEDPVMYFDADFKSCTNSGSASIIAVPCLLDSRTGAACNTNILSLAAWLSAPPII